MFKREPTKIMIHYCLVLNDSGDWKRQVSRIVEFSELIPNMTLFSRKPFWGEYDREVWELNDEGATYVKDYEFWN